jgi:hypothetical protein
MKNIMISHGNITHPLNAPCKFCEEAIKEYEEDILNGTIAKLLPKTKEIKKALARERSRIVKKAHHIVFDLTQSHDCDNDTACKFEDRAFKALEKIGKLDKEEK